MTEWPNMTPEQRIHLIRSIWREDMTSQMIADAVGATKGAVVGFYARNRQHLASTPLGKNAVEMRKSTERKPRKSRAKTEDQKAADAERRKDRMQELKWAAIGNEAIVRFPKIHRILAKDEYDATGRRVRLEENNGCMWPLNDGGPYLFCGHAKLGKYAYCQHHHVRSLGVGTEGERRAHKVSERHA